MASVYIETSIVSYLTARPSNSLIAAAWQKETADCWDTQRSRFELHVSKLVIEKKPLIREICHASGIRCPEIATPMELMGTEENGR